MKLFQISIKGHEPRGALFRTPAEARREIGFLHADDARYAAEAMSEAGIVVRPVEYEIHEVEA
jgi:hypothetical protein